MRQKITEQEMIHSVKSPCDEAALRAAPCHQPARRGVWVLVATILGSSMAFIDGSVVNVALPALQREFHAVASDTGTEVIQRNFPGDRKRIRRFASTMALDMIRRKLM